VKMPKRRETRGNVLDDGDGSKELFAWEGEGGNIIKLSRRGGSDTGSQPPSVSSNKGFLAARVPNRQLEQEEKKASG